MGNCNFKSGDKSPERQSNLIIEPSHQKAMSKNAFTMKYVIGKGGFGKVLFNTKNNISL